MLNKNTVTIFLIVVLVIIIAILGGNLLLSKRNQAPKVNTSTTKQLPQDNSQQGGPDVPGQPAAPESGAPGSGATN